MDDYVYAFASCDTVKPAIKIGRTTNLAVRLSQLRMGSPHVSDFVATFLCENATWLECALHAYFRERHVRGEWYEVGAGEFLDACADLSVSYAAVMQHERLSTTLRMKRISLDMTQTELGHKAGVRQATVSKVENCENLSVETITKVATALGMQLVLLPHSSNEYEGGPPWCNKMLHRAAWCNGTLHREA